MFATHIVSCRDEKGGRNTYESEMNVFRQDKWNNSQHGPLKVNSGNVGIQKLREEKLPKLLAENIMQNLPALEKDIESKIDEAKGVLDVIGVQPKNQGEVIAKLHDSLKSSELELKLALTPLIEEICEAIFQMSQNITREDTDQYYKPNCFDPIFFEGTYAFNKSIENFANKCSEEVQKRSKEIKDIAY